MRCAERVSINLPSPTQDTDADGLGKGPLKNGAQAYLVKTQISGDILYEAMQEAIAGMPHRDCSFGDLH
jgi:hypothetical protein